MLEREEKHRPEERGKVELAERNSEEVAFLQPTVEERSEEQLLRGRDYECAAHELRDREPPAADGRIVAGVSDVMPVVGGIIEVLNFIPDNVIIAGYFDLYTLSERAGNKFAQSEHVRFLQDQTVFKGTARYDGAPAIAEAFVAIGIKGATPNATMTFATDTANAGN